MKVCLVRLLSLWGHIAAQECVFLWGKKVFGWRFDANDDDVVSLKSKESSFSTSVHTPVQIYRDIAKNDLTFTKTIFFDV